MAGLKEIRMRLLSVKSTKQITGAMKMVSAAKLRKSQYYLSQSRNYIDKLENILRCLIINVFDENIYKRSVFFENPEIEKEQKEKSKYLLILITSNKGLCGSFNANTNKKFLEILNEEYLDLWNKKRLHIYTIGKKGEEFLKLRGFYPEMTFHDLVDKPSSEKSFEISNELINNYLKGNYSKIFIFYNYFKNPVVHDFIIDQYLPIKVDIPKNQNGYYNYILEPSLEGLLNEIIPLYLKVKFYNILLESVTSEHGSRMTAMHQATENAEGLIKELQIMYNKARQNSITNEILEIISGAEALKKYGK